MVRFGLKGAGHFFSTYEDTATQAITKKNDTCFGRKIVLPISILINVTKI